MPQRLVDVHARAVVTEDRLRHEGRGLAVAPGDVLHDVLEEHQVVGRGEQRVELVVDLGLAGGAHLVVLALDLEAGLVQLQGDLGAQVGEVVDRRGREVAALVADLVAAVVLERAGVPGAGLGVDVVEGLVRRGLEAHAVEDVELGLGAEVRGVGDAGGGEVRLGLLRHVARVTAVLLARDRVVDEEVDVERLVAAERVDAGRRQVRRAAPCRTRGWPGSRGSTSRRRPAPRPGRRPRPGP